jgi:hypothetical protein
MEMNPLNGVLIFVILLFIVNIYLGRRPSLRNGFRKMDDRKLFEMYVKAKYIRRYLLLNGLIVPPLLLLLYEFVGEPNLKRVILYGAIVIFFSCLSTSMLFYEIFMVTEAEIEFRKFQSMKIKKSSGSPEIDPG